jgi:hypothetical protein
MCHRPGRVLSIRKTSYSVEAFSLAMPLQEITKTLEATAELEAEGK